MKLFDLFEDNPTADLAPGEKRALLNISIRNLKSIENKMDELRTSLLQSIDLKDQFAKDAALQTALATLEKRINLKLLYLEKMKSRPSAGAQKMFDILDRDCSEFLKMFKETEKFLYRGLRNTASVFEGRSRADRRPKDSSNDISLRFDQALKNAGFTALRSNSIFTTSSKGFANNYGHTLYMIFPKNGFSFLSTNRRDLILSDWTDLADKQMLAEFTIELRDWMEANVEDWQNTDLGYAVKYENYSNMFIRLRMAFEESYNPHKIPDQFNKKIQDFVTDQGVLYNFDPNQTDMTESMRNGREILIHGEYWALKAEDWIDIIGTHYIPNQYGLTPSWQWG